MTRRLRAPLPALRAHGGAVFATSLRYRDFGSWFLFDGNIVLASRWYEDVSCVADDAVESQS